MPPKKAGDEVEPLEEDKDLLEKELVISYLKSKVAAHQEQSSDLQVQNYKLTEELADQKCKLKDINDFLVNELKARALSYAALQAELAETKKKMAEEKAYFTAEMTKANDSSEKYIAELLEKMADSDRKARSAEEYLGMREDLLKQLAELQEKMQESKKQFEHQISELEREHVKDRDKWKKTMHKRIQDTKQYMIQLTDNQLELTTKRTIMENEQMTAEVAYQSHQTSAIISQNKALDGRIAELRRALVLSRETENELAKRNTVYQSTIKQLLGRLRDQDAAEEHRSGGQAARDAQHEDLLQELRIRKLEAEAAAEELTAARGALAELEDAEAQRRRDTDDVGQFLLACMEDVKRKVVEVERAEQADEDGSSITVLSGHLKDLNSEQRKRVLAFLLEKLHVLQGQDTAILGLARSTSQDITLPDMASQHAPIPNLGASINPITAALDPTGIHEPAKMPITPPPRTIMPYWGGYPAGVVLHRKSGSHGALCTVSAATQTADPELESADRLLDKVMQDVRPWGTRARHHPAAGKAPGVRGKGPPAALATPAAAQRCTATTSRGGTAPRGAAVATPQGRVPKYLRGTDATRSLSRDACSGAGAAGGGVALDSREGRASSGLNSAGNGAAAPAVFITW
eukprot:jgi/Ulvmu1/885/UM100_0040.1